jgi:hypothetical protein
VELPWLRTHRLCVHDRGQTAPTLSHIVRGQPVEAVEENGHPVGAETERMTKAGEDLVIGDRVRLAAPGGALTEIGAQRADR